MKLITKENSIAATVKRLLLFKEISSHLTDINTNIIFIISSVADGKTKLVLAVHSM